MVPAHVLLAFTTAILFIQSTSAQIKFDMLQTSSCHTCADSSEESKCNLQSMRCPNMDDACVSVAWIYPDGAKRFYKKCVASKYCSEPNRTQCVTARGVQQCFYCCWGKDCNRAALEISPANWDKWA